MSDDLIRNYALEHNTNNADAFLRLLIKSGGARYEGKTQEESIKLIEEMEDIKARK